MPFPSTWPTRLLAALITAALLGMSGAAFAQQPRALITSPIGAYLAARAAEVRHDTASAAGFYARTLLDDPFNPSLIERAFVSRVAQGSIVAAIAPAASLVAIDPGNELARLTLAARDIRIANFDSADTNLDAITGDAISELIIALLKSWTLAGRGDIDAALQFLTEVDDPGWFSSFLVFNAALIADFAGRTEDAVRLAAETYEVDGSLQVIETYASLLARSGDVAAATDILGDYLSISNQPTTDALLAAIDAGDALDPSVGSVQQGVAQVFFRMGTALYSELGDFTAVPLLQLSHYLDPDDMVVVLALGEMLQDADRQLDALTALLAMDADSPLWADAEIRTALSLATLDRDEEAAAHVGLVLAKDPANLGAALTLASILRNNRDFEAANQVLDDVIAATPEFGPQHWRLFFLRGITFERTDQWPEAEADFRRALELNPDEPEVLNYLGYSWLDRGLNIDEALTMVQSAAEQRPTDGYIVDSLGWAYYLTGDYERAVEELERAVVLSPTQAIIHDHLGDAYWRAGRQLEAIYQWRQARDLDPTSEELDRIEEKLLNGLDTKDDGDSS